MSPAITEGHRSYTCALMQGVVRYVSSAVLCPQPPKLGGPTSWGFCWIVSLGGWVTKHDSTLWKCFSSENL